MMNDIQVSKRTMAALRRAGINDRQSLSGLSSHQVSLTPGIGVKGLAEIKNYLSGSTAPDPRDFESEIAEIDQLMLRLADAKDLLIANARFLASQKMHLSDHWRPREHERRVRCRES